MNMMKISLYNIVSTMDSSKKKIENSHKKNSSYCKINQLQIPNFLNKNKNSPENKSFISSDYTNSGVTLDQTKINSEKNIKISKHIEKKNFNLLNSKEHRNYMKNFISNINRSISKNKKRKILKQNHQNIELNKKENKIINLKPIFKNIRKYSYSNNDKSISEQIMSNLKNIKSTVINHNNNTISEKNSSSYLSSSLISHTSIFNSKPSNSITSSISVSKKESNNNSEIVSNLEEIPLTYSDDNVTKRKNINKNNNNLIIKKEYNENKKNDFEVFCENINKKLFG